jgi:MYXO-CTERM domain-containing protein
MHGLIRCSIGAALLFTALSARAQLAFTVSLNTAPLVGSPNGPFSLDFQLNDGSGTNDANNTATLSNFSFGGGSAAGSPTLIGGASGDIATTATITDSDFLNELTEGVTPGNTLSFDVNLTTNMDAGGTPDEFSFALLDVNGNIPTAGGGFFVIVDLDSATPTVQTFTAQDPYAAIGSPQITIAGQTVPEPSPAWFAASALLLGIALRTRRRPSANAIP